jgi:hypothetical protein
MPLAWSNPMLSSRASTLCGSAGTTNFEQRPVIAKQLRGEFEGHWLDAGSKQKNPLPHPPAGTEPHTFVAAGRRIRAARNIRERCFR